MEKVCRSCGLTKAISDYYKHPQMKDGHLNKCKECQKASTLDARNRNPEYYKEYDRKRAMLPHRVEARKEYAETDAGKAAYRRAHVKSTAKFPNRQKARYAVSNALRDGRLSREPCFVCGIEAEAHHPDYDRPLDVVWLCNAHHRQAHALIKD